MRLLACVDRFIREFEKLLPDEREQAVGDMAAFCLAYREGKDEKFEDSDGEPRVLGEVSAQTLCETMNYLHIASGGRPS